MSVNKKMTAIADAVRSYTGETDKLGLDAIAEGVNDVYNVGVYDAGYANGHIAGFNEGQQAEYDRFWDDFQGNGERRNYPNGFSGSCWSDATYNPKYEIIVTNFCGGMFTNSTQITSTKVPITIDSTIESTGVFSGCTRLLEIPSIKVTEKTLTFSGWFNNCKALTTINFTDDSVIAKSINFQWSPLTPESAWNIVQHLKDVGGGDEYLKYTITFSAAVWEALDEYAIENELCGGVSVKDYIENQYGWRTA